MAAFRSSEAASRYLDACQRKAQAQKIREEWHLWWLAMGFSAGMILILALAFLT